MRRRGRQSGGGWQPVLRLCPAATRPADSVRTTSTMEHLNEAFRRRTKTQTMLPSQQIVSTLFWDLLASGRARCERSTDGKPSIRRSPTRSVASPRSCTIIDVLGRGRLRISTTFETPRRILMETSSFGTCPGVRTALHSFEFSASMACIGSGTRLSRNVGRRAPRFAVIFGPSGDPSVPISRL